MAGSWICTLVKLALSTQRMEEELPEEQLLSPAFKWVLLFEEAFGFLRF